MKDSLSVYFDTYIKYNKYSQERLLLQLISRVDAIKKDQKSPEFFSELDQLISLQSKHNQDLEKNKRVTDSLQQVILHKIYSSEELTAIRSLYERTYEIDPSLTIKENEQAFIKYYEKLDNYQGPLFYKDSVWSHISKVCPIYWKIRSELWKENQPKIEALKEKILLKDGVPEANKKLLQALLMPDSSQDSIPTYKRVMAAVFESTDGLWSIHQMYTGSKGDSLLIDKTAIPDSLDSQLFIGDKLFKDFSAVEITDAIKIYGYSEKRRVDVELVSIGYQNDMCLESYYVYDILPKNDIGNEKIVFTSSLPLELEFNRNTEVDSLLYEHNFAICYDCGSGWASEKVIASLKGYENIYFVVTIGKKGIDAAETYIRSLRYIDKDLSFSLWSDEFDAFGCSCL
ncbi:hypothetical protein [Flammeovirga sp. SJP92]|uniref:hypothetical protein n=1 Tax=Flammeovirga sp. SJP92 TaxID=1775430 RepID=UPI0012FB6DAA|nr:hypothetical protein [Flammeovirga sp. SJP92]